MIRIRQLKLSLTTNTKNHLLKKISTTIHTPIENIISYKIIKKSLDARNKNNLLYVYELDVEVANEDVILSKNKSSNILKSPQEEYKFSKLGTTLLQERPLIIGSGPAGLFCAYLLAENGYKPIIIERGEKVEDRLKSVINFWTNNILNPNSNIQFGEGGAGTFSDGKLNTLVKDKFFRGKKVFEIFVENGAPEDIMYLQKPHIGTDILQKVIINMRNKITAMGGEFLYNTTLTNLKIRNNQITGIEINNKQIIPTNIVVLAIGHSARDTFTMLKDNNLLMQAKSFAVGLRISHPQSLINKAQYGDNASLLPPASYKLTYQTKDHRGVYTFCMCPGGYIVNASSEANHLAINGMSYHKRDSENANSAIVVTVTPKDFGNDILSGMNYQRHLESLAYKTCNGKISLQTLKDFKNNQKTTAISQTPSIKGAYAFSNLNTILPSYISASIKEALPHFAKKISGFANDDTLLYGVESRTSSPIRIIRDENFTSNIAGVYPCGEGAGYSGGITTSAIDGIKVAEAIAKKYKPFS